MRQSFRWLAVVMLIAVLAGCTAPAAAPAGQAGAGAAAPAEKVKITFWFDTTGGSTTAECVVKNVIDPYNAQSTNIQVEAVLQANGWDATRTALAGGGGPDVVVTPGPSFAYEMAKAGQLVALDDYATQLGWDKSFVPWALKLGVVDGKLYSLPNEVETLLLYYNKTLFEQNGWAPPKTMDELMTLSQQIADAGIIPFGHSNAEWRPTNEWFVGEWLNHVAGPDKVYSALRGETPWTDPAFKEAIDMLTTIQQNGWFMGGLDRYYTATNDERHAAFGDGKAAMNLEGTWFASTVNNFFGEAAGNTNEWDWVPVPSTGGEAIFDLGIGSTYSINAASKHPQETAEFITHFFSPETQAIMLAQCGTAPAPVQLKADALTGIDPRVARMHESLGQAASINNYGYTTWTFWPPKSDSYIYEEIEKVWSGDMTSDQYLQGLQDLFQEEMQAGAMPPLPVRETSN